MKISEKAPPGPYKKSIAGEKDKNCCVKCANRTNSLNAHCGKSHTMAELMGQDKEPGNQVLRKLFTF